MPASAMEVEAKLGQESEVTGLAGVETAASGAQSHQCHLSAHPTAGSGDRGVGNCFLPRRGKNVHTFWGQLSTHLQRMSFPELQLFICVGLIPECPGRGCGETS